MWTTCMELLLDSGPTGNRTHDRLIASPVMQPSHPTGDDNNNNDSGADIKDNVQSSCTQCSMVRHSKHPTYEAIENIFVQLC